MIVTAADLIGAWRLVKWSLIYADGRPQEFPLGPDARGMIIYTATGEVSATLMRADDGSNASPTDHCFAYAGRYVVRDGTAYHTIEITTNPALVGITSTRHIQLDGDQLTLAGPDFAAGTERTQHIVWRRA
jgi:Lipocalin-like domain